MAEPVWRSSSGRLVPLGDVVELVPLPKAWPTDGEQRVSNWWWQLFNADRRDVSWERDRFLRPVDDSAAAPACIARVVLWDLDGLLTRSGLSSIEVRLGEPVNLVRTVSRTAPGPVTASELDEFAAVLGRWPALASVEVEDLSPYTQSIVDGLSARGLPNVTVGTRPSEISVSIDDEPDDEDERIDSAEWRLTVRPYWVADPWHGRRFLFPVDDTARIADVIVRVGADGPVVVAASDTTRSRLTRDLDARGVPWQVDPIDTLRRQVPPPPFTGTGSRDGLTLRLAVTGQGWVEVTIAVGDASHTVTGSAAFTDALNDFVTAVRKAVTYQRTTWCAWNDEPGDTHIVIIPNPHDDSTTIELWRDEDEHPRTPRTDTPLHRWNGPTFALAAAVHDATQAMLHEAGTHGVDKIWGSAPPSVELELLSVWLQR